MTHAELLKMMGRHVLVSKVLKRQHEKAKAWYETEDLPKPRTGWMVGIRHLQIGETKPGSPRGMGGEFDEWEPAEWKTSGVVKCVMVAFWPTQKPVPVPLDGFLEAQGDAPKPYCSAGGWDDNATWRKEFSATMKAEMKDWPRDEKGRWVSKS